MAGDDIQNVTYPKGKVLFKQGDKGTAAYIVNSGAIGLYREAMGRKIPLATVRKGELFGEMAVVDSSPRMATAFTIEESTLTVVSVETMKDKMKKADGFIRALISMLMSNLRQVHDSHTPRSRSLLDAVNTLHRQGEIVTRFLQADLPAEFRAGLEAQLRQLDAVLKDLRRLAMAHRDADRRTDAIPAEADLPH